MFIHETDQDFSHRHSYSPEPWIRDVTTHIYNYLTWSGNSDGTVIIKREMPYQDIYWWYEEDVENGYTTKEKQTEANCYVSATGGTINDLYVLGGGSASNVTCNSLGVGMSEDYTYLQTLYFNDESSSAFKSTYVFSGITYSFGSASNCTVNGVMDVSAGTASSCTVNGVLRVEATNSITLYYPNETIPIKCFAGTISNCKVNGDFYVDDGAKATSTIVVNGIARIGSNPANFEWIPEDQERYQLYQELNEKYRALGDPIANDLTVVNGHAYVYQGQLNGANIDGMLATYEGAKLGGTITCKSICIEDLSASTAAITIKVDLNDYALPVETRHSNTGDSSIKTDYYADLHKTVTVTNSNGTSISSYSFNPAQEGLDPTTWRNTFYADLGSIGEYALKGGFSDITIDLQNTLSNFDEGTIRITGKTNGSSVPIHINEKENKFSILLDEQQENWLNGYEYNSAIFGEGYEVLWLDQGVDESVEYIIELPDDCMQGANENVSILARDNNGQISDAPCIPAEALKNNALTVSAAESNDLVIKAEEQDGREHQCDLELWVVPEVIPGLDKNTTGKFAELLKQSQGNTCNLSATWPNIHTSLLGVGLDLTGMGVTFTVTKDRTASLKMQGKLEWAISDQRAGTGKNTKLVFDLSGDNYIAIRMPWKQMAVLDVVGTMTCPDFSIGKFGFSNVSLSIDTTSNSWKVGAFVTLPGVSYAIGGEIGVVDGCWDSITLGVDNLNVPLGTTGLMLQKVTGTVKDMATALDMTFGGTLGLTYGPTIQIDGMPQWLGIDDGDYALLELTVTAEICTDGTLSGSASLVSLGNLISGSGTVAANTGHFVLNGEFGMLNNCITITGELTSTKDNVTISGTGRMQLPNEKEKFGFLAGTGIAVSAYANFQQRYVMAWEEAELFGNKLAFGIRCTFDGDVDLIGATSIVMGGSGNTRGDAEAQFELDGNGIALFQCTITSGQLDTVLHDEAGNTYTQANILVGAYNNIQIVQELCSNTCITIAVNQPAAGTWTMVAYDNDTAEMTCSVLNSGNQLSPEITSVAMGDGNRSATINYTLGNLAGLENVSLSIFCDMPGAQNVSKLRIAQFEPATATGSYTWEMEDDFLGGNYSFHLMVEANGIAPVESTPTASYAFAVIDTEKPDTIARTTPQWSGTGTTISWEKPYDNIGVAGYKFRYGTDAENLQEVNLNKNQFTFEQLPNGIYSYQVAAYDTAGNTAEWSAIEETLVNTKQNATYKNLVLAENLELEQFEGATSINAADVTITTAANSLLADSTIGDAQILGIAENLTVNGAATLGNGGKLDLATVNGELALENNCSASNITVNNGAILTVGNCCTVDGVTAKTGSMLILKQGADYKNMTLEDGVSLAIVADTTNSTNKFLMTDDIHTSGTVLLERYLYGNGHNLYLDIETGYVNDMSKVVGNALVIVSDCNQKGSYLIANDIALFNRTLSLQSKDGANTVTVGFDAYEIMGDYACILAERNDKLYLDVVTCSLEAPVITVEGNVLDTIDDITVNFSSFAEDSKQCKLRYSINADMSDAVIGDTQSINQLLSPARAFFSKDGMEADTTYYLQASTQDNNGFWSEWSDAISFTVTPKYVPLAPIVTGASIKSYTSVTLKANPDERGSSYTFRYADNPEMENAIELYDYGTNYGSISKTNLDFGKTYYAQVNVPLYGWSETAAFTLASNADYENYTVTSEDEYFKLEYNQTANNLTIANDDAAWCSISGSVNGLTTLGGFTRLDEGCSVTDLTVEGGTVWLGEGNVSNLTIKEGTSARLMHAVVNNALISGTLNADYNENTPLLTGTIVIQGKLQANVSYLASQADFVFDIAAHEDIKETPFINNYKLLTGLNTYSLNIGDTPAIGDYLLTGNAYAEEITFTLKGTNNSNIAIITAANEPVLYDGQYYSIINTDTQTYLHVSNKLQSNSIISDSLSASANGASWQTTRNVASVVQYSNDNFATALERTVNGNEISTLNMPANTYQWRVRAQDEDEWVVGTAIEANQNSTPSLVTATQDNVDDLMFATTYNTWSSDYYAQHLGCINVWEGTQEQVALQGKNKIEDIFQGSADSNTLYLTDTANGDAIFVDDIYSALPNALPAMQSRLAQIQEIQAGAGDDIVDMTSQQFAYVGGGITIRGGNGNDVIWANSGSNQLFGDAGDDRLVGSNGNDVLVGGSGNDSMHGGGGNDVFCFCDNWGQDTVTQLPGGTVTLWFAQECALENTQEGTYAYNGNTVTISGVAPENITFKYGDDGSEQYTALLANGCFNATSSTHIYC